MENKLERVNHSPKVLERLSPKTLLQKPLTSQDSLQNLQSQLILLHLTLAAWNLKDFKLSNLKNYLGFYLEDSKVELIQIERYFMQ